MTDRLTETVWDVFETAAAAEPWKDLLVLPDARHSYGEIRAQALRMSAGLRGLGIGRGDLVAIWLPNGLEWVVSFLACAHLGAVVVAVNTRLKAGEIAYLLDHTQAALMVLPGQAPGLIDIASELMPELREERRPERFSKLRSVVHTGDGALPGMHAWGTLLSTPEALEPTSSGRDDVVLLQYTSGSTGRPKGAMLTHGGVTRSGFELGRRMGLGPDDRFFVPNPFFHVAGTVSGLMNVLAHHATLVTLPYHEASAALELQERESCTGRLGLDAVYMREMEHADFPRRRLSLRKGTCMGSEDVFRRAHRLMGMRDIISLYALSETSATVATTRPGDPIDVRATTVGTAQPGTELRIDGTSGQGEILVRGWGVMRGYFRDPAATSAAIDADGWLHTGDLGAFGPDGNLRFLGRLKDVIRVGGENVAAVEVQEFLQTHPSVRLAVVVAAPDPELGEVPVAFVELRPGSDCTAETLARHCHGRIARFKVPRLFEFVEEWPLTGSGKVEKALLRQRAAALRAARGGFGRRAGGATSV